MIIVSFINPGPPAGNYGTVGSLCGHAQPLNFVGSLVAVGPLYQFGLAPTIVPLADATKHLAGMMTFRAGV